MPLTARLCGASVFEKFAQKIRGGWRWARSVIAIIVSVIIASHHIRLGLVPRTEQGDN